MPSRLGGVWSDIPLDLFPNGLTGAAEIIGALEIEPEFRLGQMFLWVGQPNVRKDSEKI